MVATRTMERCFNIVMYVECYVSGDVFFFSCINCLRFDEMPSAAVLATAHIFPPVSVYYFIIDL